MLSRKAAVNLWWTLVFCGSLPLRILADSIVINEIHYNPDIKTEPVEFIELYNAGTNTVNLGGWSFTDGLDYAFPATNLAPASYVVVAQNPAFLATKYGAIGALGPFAPDGSSQLSKWGNKITLLDAAGKTVDQVEYSPGFPWPTVGDTNAPGLITAAGCSIELINPSLDNNLGGSWRSSLNYFGQTLSLITNGSVWKYHKGTNEASTPTTAWRALAFDDSTWNDGAGPIGYELMLPMNTVLSDMKSNYSSIFLRKTFVLNDLSTTTNLLLEVMYNGGFKVWVNETNALNVGMPSTEVPYNALSTGPEHESANYELYVVNARNYLRIGSNIVVFQVANVALTNEDFFFDARVKAQVGPALQGPTPGRRNSVYATNAPPQIRQVQHTPEQPMAGDVVKITAKVTDPDGVAGVLLEYQVVDPGNYIELTDPAYTNNWVAVPMNDNGTQGDLTAGDEIYSADVPASVQTNRRLIRYRITVADQLGFFVRVPYADDPQPNFAYFVYNGVPAWQGAIKPGAPAPTGTVFTVSAQAMGRLPVYQLIAKSNTVVTATWLNGWDMGSLYRWAGTLVYDGKVYDHIHYRMRGGVWRYSMVKNMWKFDLNRGHDFEARDNWGHKYKVPWGKLSLGSCIQQGDYWHRGEQGMFESVGSRLFQLAGVDAFATAFVTFRIIDDAAESKPDQYDGDFWGLYITVENEDGRFLDNHNLPDSNFYKMDGGYGSPPAKLSNLGPNGPADQSDIKWLLANYTSSQPETWFRTNWNLGKYYSYQAILQAFHHYDINGQKNYFYYFDPRTQLWEVMPWDLDLTWAHNMYNNSSGWGGLNPLALNILKAITESGTGSQSGTYNVKLSGDPARPNFEREFRNRVREIRDLLFNNDQAWRLIEEYAWLARGPTNTPTIIEADRCQWDFNPKMDSSTYSKDLSKAKSGRYYVFAHDDGTGGESTTNSSLKGSFDATIQIMKNYVLIRSEHLDSVASDAAIPNRPAITYTGPSNNPISRITLHCSNFSTPTNSTFASLRWRVGEISDYDTSHYDPSERWKYEIETVWDSGDISVFTPDITIPGGVLRVGSHYRVRVRFTDNTGRNSNWSLPYEFICGVQDNMADLMNYLRITEVMYNPPPGGFEYIELHNFSPTVALDLGGVRFTDGIDFAFANGTVIPPGGYLLVIGTPMVNYFRAFYNLDGSVPIVAYWTGALNNAGERLELKTSAGGSNIVAFSYGDGRGWPQPADGAGHSLVLLDSVEAAEGDGAGEYAYNWRASTYLNGSPGRADSILGASLLINEIAANTQSTNDPLGTDDWIELYNPNDAPLTLGPNWFLSDDSAVLKKWMIPSNTVVPAKGFVTFDEETGFHNPTNIGFGINMSGEQIFFSYLPGTAEDRVVDSVSFKAQELGWTWGRYPNGGPYWSQLTPTPGTNNAAPGLHLVINELMYHPPDIGGTNDNSQDEFIELYNPTASPVPLYNTNGPWRLNGGVSLDFPANLVLDPGEYMLAVNFNPLTNLTQLAAFKALYSVTDPNLKIVGPYGGKLNNSSDRVALEKPQFDLPDNPAWVLVDEVLYLDQAPWPCGSDGSGASLNRLSAFEHGNNPANWTAQAPTPGAARPATPAGAPTIVAQPLSQRVPANSTVMFLVNLCGPQPYFLQWLFNGQPLANATNNVLILDDVGITNSGQYQVVVSNYVGATYSTIATLEVYYAPVIIVQQPKALTAKGASTVANYGRVPTNVIFSVMATGSRPISYQWYRDDLALDRATNAMLTLTSATLADEGYYSVLISNVLGTVTSSSVRLKINVDPALRQQPPQTTVAAGSTVGLSVVSVGNPMPLGYRWKRDGAGVIGGYFYTNSTNCTLTLANVGSANAGLYSVTVTNSAYSTPGAISSNIFVTVVVPPANRIVSAGANTTFSVTAYCGSSTSKLRYQWKFGETNLPAMTNTSLTVTNVQAEQEGLYTVVITNPTNYPAAFTAQVWLNISPPFILNQPQSLTVTQGATAAFSVNAGGPGPLLYQWKFNGGDILDATNGSLSLPNVQDSDQGPYTVFVSNTNGSVLSSPATLSLGVPPTITAQPEDQSVHPGDPATFSVTAEGTVPLFYQWRLNATNITDATNADLLLSDAQSADQGAYTVVVTNCLGSVTSAPAILTVVPRTNSPPQILAVPAQVSVDEQTLLSLALHASDPDWPGQTLTWQVGPDSPVGLSIDGASGLLTWTPEEDQGPSTSLVTVMVSDDGTPALSDTAVISIVVNEINRPPALNSIADQWVNVLTSLILTNIATDPDLPANHLSFTLDAGVPVGAHIDPSTGRFVWKPTLEQAPSTNLITVRVTDDGLPSYSDTKSFLVMVGNYLQLGLGSNVVLAGQSGSVDIKVCSKIPITNINFLLTTPVPGLTNFTLPPPVLPLARAEIGFIAPSQWQVNLQWANDNPFMGTQTVSSLQFESVTDAPSAFIGLEVTNLSSTQLDGTPLMPSLANAGRVVLINESPLTEVHNDGNWLQIILYGEPGSDCVLESTPTLDSPSWSSAWEGLQTNLSQSVLVPIASSNRFYRVFRP